jgi:hypothetical protein
MMPSLAFIARCLAQLWAYGPSILVLVGTLLMLIGTVALLLGVGQPD